MIKPRLLCKVLHLLGVVALVLAFAGIMSASEVGVGGIGFDVTLGYAGHFRPNTWVPLQVTITNEGVPFDAHVEVITSTGSALSSYQTQVVYRRLVSLPSGTKKKLLITFPITSTYRPIDVRLVEMNGNVLHSVRIPLRDAGVTSDIVLVLDTTGERWTWLQEVALDAMAWQRRSRVYVAHVQSVNDLPDEWVAYESVRTIILTDTFPISALSKEQTEAILRWVEVGGHMLVSGGPGMNLAAVPELAAKLPVTLTGGTRVLTLRQLSWEVPSLPAPFRTVVWNAQPNQGQVDLAVEGTPIIAHQWLGTGRITYLGFDLAARSLRSWSGLDSFSRQLVFPPRMVRRSTTVLERNLLPLLTNLRVPYPRHLWLFLFAIIYLAAVSSALRIASNRRLGWAVLLLTVLVGSGYVQFVVRAQAAHALRAYGEVRITQVPPQSGLAQSTAMAQMVNMRGGDWTIRQDSGVYMAPASTFSSNTDALLVVEQGGTESRIGPTQARRTLAVTSQTLLDVPISVSLSFTSERMRVTIENKSPWMLRSAFYIDQERYVSLGDVPAGQSSNKALPNNRFVISTDALSPDWIAASVATVAAQVGKGVDKRAQDALAQIVAYALTPDRDTLELPWGNPLVIAMLDSPVTPPLTESFTGLGYHFVVIPLSSLVESQY